MATDALARVRALCLALPEAHEEEAWGSPTFRVRNKIFAYYAEADNHHGAGHHAVWCKATPTSQQHMIASDPERYFLPPYVGPKGWIGMRLDRRVSWRAVDELLRDAYRLTAPKKLLASLDD
jgi:hypothetical protein